MYGEWVLSNNPLLVSLNSVTILDRPMSATVYSQRMRNVIAMLYLLPCCELSSAYSARGRSRENHFRKRTVPSSYRHLIFFSRVSG